MASERSLALEGDFAAILRQRMLAAIRKLYRAHAKERRFSLDPKVS